MNNFYSLISIFPGFNIINAPATGGKKIRKCIQFTSNSVSYALKVIGTNPPTLKFMVSAQSIHGSLNSAYGRNFIRKWTQIYNS